MQHHGTALIPGTGPDPPNFSCPAGLPTNNATTYCPENGTSCFYAMTGSVAFSQARTTCSGVKGYVISYGDASEQLAVEQYFLVCATDCRLYATRSACID
jgi:hypothetical protein